MDNLNVLQDNIIRNFLPLYEDLVFQAFLNRPDYEVVKYKLIHNLNDEEISKLVDLPKELINTSFLKSRKIIIKKIIEDSLQSL